MANSIKFFAKTDIGIERDHNEDNFILNPKLAKRNWLFEKDRDYKVDKKHKGSLLVVADGMGGMEAGEIASELAIEKIKEYFDEKIGEVDVDDPKDIQYHLKTVIQNSNLAILQRAATHPDEKGMGTTIILSWIIGPTMYTAWVGDSRTYLYRRSEDLFFQISEDHSYVQELVNQKKITPEQAFFHPESNIITQSLGDASKNGVDPGFVKTHLQKDDLVLVCSDGLNGMLQDKEIKGILTEKFNQDLNVCAENLIQAANEAGGADNITVALAKMEKIEIGSIPFLRAKFLFPYVLVPLLIAITTLALYIYFIPEDISPKEKAKALLKEKS